jgi:hypothetical protein
VQRNTTKTKINKMTEQFDKLIRELALCKRGPRCAQAIQEVADNLDCLRYLHEHGYPCEYALRKVNIVRHPECVRYLHERGYAWDVTMLLTMAQWLLVGQFILSFAEHRHAPLREVAESAIESMRYVYNCAKQAGETDAIGRATCEFRAGFGITAADCISLLEKNTPLPVCVWEQPDLPPSTGSWMCGTGGIGVSGVLNAS